MNKANSSDTEAPFLDLHLSVANGFVSSKFYDKRDDFDFDIVNFPFLMVTFLVVLLMVFTFRNLLGLLESAIMLLIVPRRYFCGGSFCFMSWCLNFFVLLVPYVCFHIFN